MDSFGQKLRDKEVAPVARMSPLKHCHIKPCFSNKKLPVLMQLTKRQAASASIRNSSKTPGALAEDVHLVVLGRLSTNAQCLHGHAAWERSTGVTVASESPICAQPSCQCDLWTTGHRRHDELQGHLRNFLRLQIDKTVLQIDKLSFAEGKF